MYHMDMISRNSDDGSINLVVPIILAAETYQKDNLHLGKETKADDREDFTKATEKKILPQKMFGKYFQNHCFQLQHT